MRQVFATALLAACVAPLAALAPRAQDAGSPGSQAEPSALPISWELKFEFLDIQRLERIEVKLPDRDEPDVYWYIVYTATNTSGRTQHFFPMFQIVTEDLRTFDSDCVISPLVVEHIQERHRHTHPYLMHPTKAIGDLMSGQDNARESVAIWPQIDLNVNKFSVFVAGLSGEKRFVPNPAFDPGKPETVTETGPDGKPRERTVNPKYFTLRKTLEIPYTLPGAPETRARNKPVRGTMRWVMR